MREVSEGASQAATPSSNSFTIYPGSSARVRMYEQLRGIAEDPPITRRKSRQMSSALARSASSNDIDLPRPFRVGLVERREDFPQPGCLRKTETSLALNLM